MKALALALILVAAPGLAADSSRKPAAPSADAYRDPCQGGPFELVFTVAAPDGTQLVITEDARPRADALARRSAVLANGLDVAPDPTNGEESFYPEHRILLVVLRPIC